MIKEKPIWRKIKGKWVNLVELSKTKTYTSAMVCNEFKQINTYSRTNRKSKF
jgi:hypothetical protein|tara:strand:+ start:150 stop:305 length:156 start_codon:yes stop_codon:yes gene_type:complete